MMKIIKLQSPVTNSIAEELAVFYKPLGYTASSIRFQDTRCNYKNYRLLAIDNNEFIGGIHCLDYIESERSIVILDIGDFLVKDTYRNKGVGSQLLQYLINSCDSNIDAIRLAVDPDNQIAIHLYKKYNFSEYKSDSNFIYMIKYLKE